MHVHACTSALFPLCACLLVFCSFDFCQPKGDSKDRDPVENLGQVVFGERLRASGYEVGFTGGQCFSYKEVVVTIGSICLCMN